MEQVGLEWWQGLDWYGGEIRRYWGEWGDRCVILGGGDNKSKGLQEGNILVYQIVQLVVV